jgi:hypothetical protein
MRKIGIYKSGDLVATLNVPENSQDVKGEVYFIPGLPFEAHDRIANYALGQSNVVTYREWRWAWNG